MKLQQGPLDGAVSRAIVLQVLRAHGVVLVPAESEGFYELEDLEQEPAFIKLTDPVRSQMLVFLWRRFGVMHGFKITAFHAATPKH